MTSTETVKPLLHDLIGFDTTSRNSNVDLIDYIKGYLQSHGVASETIFNASKDKANLMATLGPDTGNGLVLSGHTDVVPVDGQEWDTAPFALTEKDSRFYGRGTADMKSFIAVALGLVPYFLSLPLKRPIHLSFTYDEEVGCIGVHSLVAALSKRTKKPALAVIGEPTEMRVIHAHKGIHSFRTTVTGHEAHSSAVDKGVNAVAIAAELISFLNQKQQERKKKQENDPVAQQFDPPYSTIHVGTIHGGTARNIIPKECTFFWEIRTVPNDDGETLLEEFFTFCQKFLPEMQRISSKAGIETEALTVVPGLQQNDDLHWEQQLLALSGYNKAETVAFGTEAGIFQQEGGIPAIICGPGSIMQAHKPNEYIEIPQIERCIDFVQKLVAKQCC